MIAMTFLCTLFAQKDGQSDKMLFKYRSLNDKFDPNPPFKVIERVVTNRYITIFNQHKDGDTAYTYSERLHLWLMMSDENYRQLENGDWAADCVRGYYIVEIDSLEELLSQNRLMTIYPEDEDGYPRIMFGGTSYFD